MSHRAAEMTHLTPLQPLLPSSPLSSGQFTSWLQANGYPAASVTQPPGIAVLTGPAATPAAAPSEPYVWAVGVVVGFVVFVYLFWSGSRRIRMRNKLAKRNLDGDDDDFYGIGSGGSSVGDDGDDGDEDDWEEDDRRGRYAGKRAAAAAAGADAAAMGGAGAAARYNYDDFEEDDGTETGTALNVGALGAAAAVAGSRAAAAAVVKAAAAAERQSRINNRFVRPRVFAPEDGDDEGHAEDDFDDDAVQQYMRGQPSLPQVPARRSTATIAPTAHVDDTVDEDEIILI